MGILFICGALAAGEFAASFVPVFAEAWPIPALLAVFVALLGYGLGWRGGHLAAVFLLGFALYLSASVESERLYREKPWMRGVRSYARQERRAPLVRAVKTDFSRRVGIGLGHDCETVALNRAILLGERARLPMRTKRVFVESGTMHVFAISGLHVMAVAKVLVCLLALGGLSRRGAGVAAIPILWGYVYLIGSPPSAIRAVIMASSYYLAPLFWRRPNLLRAWALAFLLIHLVSPLMVTNVGNALSFSVMLALALAVEWECRAGVRVPSVVLAVVVWAAGVPIAAHVFGRVTPGGIVANLVLITAATWTVFSGVVGVLASFLSETLAAHLNNLSALCTQAMVGVSELVSRLPYANFEVGRWTFLQCAAWYLLIGLVMLLAKLIQSRKVF